MSFILMTCSLLKREVVRFLRQRSRVVGALATPLVFWFFIGSGIGTTFQSTQIDYLHYFFPGTLVLILLFTAIFSTISIIEDRQEGFLQGILVSPAPRSAIVLGKFLGGTILAVGQGILFLAFLPLLKISINIPTLAYVILIMTLMSFGLTGLGFIIAWKLNSTQGFHAIMNLLLMPMWFLSGALFPFSTAPQWLKTIMLINPLTYSVAALHRSFFFGLNANIGLPAPGVSLAVVLIFSVMTFAISIYLVRKN